MIGFLHSKAKVARNLMAVAFLLLIISSAQSQSKISAGITCSFKSVRLDHVIDFLSRSTGMNFIYSSNKVEVSQLVSFYVKEKSLIETLAILSKQLNLSFKMEGEHIVVKALPQSKKQLSAVTATTHQISVNQKIITEKARLSDSTQLDPKAQHYLAVGKTETISSLSVNGYGRKHLTDLQPYFDTTFLKRIPLQYIQNISTNNFHAGWFISAGPIINDYSNGMEIQAGIRSIYAVFTPTWLRQDGAFHGAYGLGTSTRLKRNLSINLVYTYASLNMTDKYYETMGSKIFELQLSQKTSHHQVKLMMQYAFTKNLSIKAGPTFNQAKILYLNPNPAPRSVFHYHDSPDHDQMYTSGQALKNSQIVNLWVGWEAGLSYKVNFLHKP